MGQDECGERNKKRERLVKQHAAAPQPLERTPACDESLPLEEAFRRAPSSWRSCRATSSPRAHPQPLAALERAAARHLSQFKLSRIALRNLASTGQIPAWSSRAGKGRNGES